MLTPTVSRIVIGERGEINKMLNKVSHIGKECNIGYGRVEHRTIEPTEAL
jgi:CRISPR type IV-associated protein Csf3